MELQWNHKIFSCSASNFDSLALEAFRVQYQEVTVYRHYVDALGVLPDTVNSLSKIPFLPIQFFKSAQVTRGAFQPESIFESSATTGMTVSRHLVKELALYEESFAKGFDKMYGDAGQYCIIGLLPSYLERSTSSLVYMVKSLIEKSGHSDSGFYLNEWDKLHQTLLKLETAGQRTLLIGVSFALLELADKFPMQLKHTRIIETGGMKGRGREMVKQEMHDILKAAFQVEKIEAEYGMTELLSQAWSSGEGIYSCPPWMKVVIRDDEDPLQILQQGAGAINVVDLANINSCCFIATEDAGKVYENGQFEILGRMDGSDLRGCSLLVV